MSEMEIQAEAIEKLAYIEDKYDIFFRANEKQLSDYLEVDFRQGIMMLKLKANTNLPFTLVNDLKQYFRVER
ncbi:MAG TPA: hypothetical protein VG367_19960 [Mucilaginibacter sp.]|jgi:hypothetical protein|nr:hypothetical protein [Mucilaginibacter sp.]